MLNERYFIFTFCQTMKQEDIIVNEDLYLVGVNWFLKGIISISVRYFTSTVTKLVMKENIANRNYMKLYNNHPYLMTGH